MVSGMSELSSKSITFRCNEKQHRRMEAAIAESGMNRTEFITKALEEFLNFADQEEVKKMNLFELVDAIDNLGAKEKFEEQS